MDLTEYNEFNFDNMLVMKPEDKKNDVVLWYELFMINLMTYSNNLNNEIN